MLTRDRLGDDRRRQALALTEQGRWVLESAQTALRERLAGLLADIPPRETDALARLLESLEASLSGTPPPPRPPRPPGRGGSAAWASYGEEDRAADGLVDRGAVQRVVRRRR